MLKRYCTLDEAAEFLTSQCKQRISTRDVLELAARGDVRLCFWFDGTLSTFEDFSPIDEPNFVSPSYTFRGYIQIPKESINPEGGDAWFNAAKITDVVQALNGEPMPENWTCGRYFMGQYDCEPERGCFHIPFSVEIDAALIPVVDLLGLSKDLTKALPTENSLLGTIAALLAAWPGGKSPSGKDLEKAAESVGVAITDDTIRKAMKSAREIAKGLPPA